MKRIHFKSTRQLFPRESALAHDVWALWAVYSDLQWEMEKLADTTETVLQMHRNEYLARLYFFRGSVRSLYSAGVVLNRLRRHEQFNRLAGGDLPVFNARLRAVNRHMQEFQNLRNAFGAHVENDVAASLDRADPDHILTLELDSEMGFNTNIGAQALFQTLMARTGTGTPTLEDLNAVIVRMRDAAHACIRVIYLVFQFYSREYSLLPTRARWPDPID